MTEKSIIRQLFKYVNDKGHRYMCSTTHSIPGVGEADFISVTQAGYVHEYEIKCTVSDYKADFRNKVSKHKSMKDTALNNSNTEVDKPFVNYYWFVMPKNLVHVDEIPDYAGLLYVDSYRSPDGYEYLSLGVIKTPKRFHANKIDTDTLLRMFRSVMYRYYHLI